MPPPTFCRATSQKPPDSIEKLAQLVVDSMDELRSDMNGRFDTVGDQLSALQDRITGVESKIAGLHRRIDLELDTRKQHDVRLTRIERQLGLTEAA